jgi:hypothetical protein
MALPQPFLAFAYSLVVNECGELSPETGARVISLLQELISFPTTRSTEISQQIASVIGRGVSAVDRINAILKVPSKPIPNPRPVPLSAEMNRKSNLWSQMEDDRLLAGIHKYGLNRWPSVAKFVGNGRTKAQCGQRWNRTLNPQLKKTKWSNDEEFQLAELVARYGPKSWTRIADEMVTRSDVQCRYHWLQIQRNFKKISQPSGPAQEQSGPSAQPRTAAGISNLTTTQPNSTWDWIAPTGLFDTVTELENDENWPFF